jgi:hypothetical protein
MGWTLLGLGWFLNSVAAYVVTKAPEHEVLATGLVVTVILLLTVGLWQMRRFAIIAFAVTCLVLSAIQTLNAVGMLLTGGPHIRTAAILIYFIVPSVFLGMYCLQHDFLKKARAYRKSRRPAVAKTSEQ